MTALERRYRHALRWFPAGWRRENGEALLGTLLDRAEDEGRDHPRRGELADLARSGMIAHGRAAASVVPAPARRLAGSAAIGAGAVYSLFALLSTEVPPPGWTPDIYGLYHHPWMFGPFLTPGALVFLLWIAAFAALLLRWRRTGAWLLTGAVAWGVFVYPVAGPTFTVRIHDPWPYSDGLESLLPNGLSFLFLTMLGLLALGDRARLSSRRAGLAGAVVAGAVVGFVALSVAVRTTLGMLTDSILWSDQPPLALSAAALVGVGALVAAHRNPAAGVATAILAAPIVVTMLVEVTMLHGLRPSLGGAIVYGLASVLATVAIVAVVLRRPGRDRTIA